MTRTGAAMRGGLALLGLLSLVGTALVHEPHAQEVNAAPVAWMIFVDDLHLSFSNTGRLRILLGTILNELPEDGDLVSIRTSGPSTLLTDFGSSRDLTWQLKKVVGNGLRLSDVVAAPRDREVRYRAQLSLSVATGAAAALGQVDRFGRALVYVSEGHPLDVTALAEGRALAQTAGASGVRVFVVDGRMIDDDRATPSDPRLMEYVGVTRTSLRVIAEQSGGFAVFDRQALPAALDEISNAMR